ncbi:MAG: alginate export family protein, partial [Candidatus Methylomirabilis sp.]|nr:alginate export family protein [Deltaproteobacteria bacterium]
VRLRPEYGRRFFPTGPVDLKGSNDVLTRLRSDLWVDVRPHETLRAFVKVRDVRDWGDEPSTVSTGTKDESTDLYEGYLEIIKPFDVPVKVRGGRQAIAHANERLVGPLDWLNNGRSFDAARLWVDGGGGDFANGAPGEWLLDGFFAQINEEPGPGDDDGYFGGALASVKIAAPVSFEAFTYVLTDGATSAPVAGTAGLGGGGEELTLWTSGGRVEWSVGDLKTGSAAQLKGDAFGAVQYGNFGPRRVEDAFAAYATVSAGVPLWEAASAWLGYEYSYGSGDNDPGDKKLSTFSNLFPTNHMYYGYMDLFSLQNLSHHQVGLAVIPCESVKIALDGHWFFLDEERDAWYRATGAAVARDPSGRSSRDLGEEIDLTVWYTYNQYLKFMAGYSHFFPGTFARKVAQSGGAGAVSGNPALAANVKGFRDADWAYVQVLLAYP